MEKLLKLGHLSFGLGIAAMGFQQLFYAKFRPVFLPPLPSWMPLPIFWVYLFSAIFMVAGLSIIFDKRAREISLILGGYPLSISLFKTKSLSEYTLTFVVFTTFITF